MALPQPPFEGACLCGTVKIRVTAPPLLTLACHCRDCQKFSASAYSLTTMFPADSVTMSGDLITGGLGATDRRHHFCASCLNFVYSQVKGSEHRINLRTSLLDNAAAFHPFVELMTDEKLPWATVPVVQSFPRFPQTREEVQALMDGYAKT